MDRLARHGTAIARKARRGFSLVELMVALTLSLVVLAGVLGIFMSSRKTYETTDRLSRIQDSGRFALQSIVRDLRSAGYPGCSQRAPFTNTLNTPTALLWNFAVPIQGFEGEGDTWAPTLDTTVATQADPNSDALVVRIPRGDLEPVRVAPGFFMTGTTDDIHIEDVTPALIETGDIVQISDCNARAVLQVTANDAGVISHAAGEATEHPPGNATDDIGYAFTDRAELVPMQTVIYYLRQASTPAFGTSLWRRASGENEPEELVEGIENMQLRFGESDGTDLVYRRADEVGDWQRVLTVRIALLVRSLSEYGTDADHGKYELLDETVTDPGDRHLRQVFTTTVTVRNTIT